MNTTTRCVRCAAARRVRPNCDVCEGTGVMPAPTSTFVVVDGPGRVVNADESGRGSRS